MTHPEESGAPPGARRLALEGAFQSLGQSLGETYLAAFALFLGAQGVTLGLIASLPTGATALAQLLARQTRAGLERTRACVAGAWAVQALAYGLLGLCVYLASGWSLVALGAVACLTWGAGGFGVPAWTALVVALVPRARHGWFFALRGAAQQAAFLVATLLGGVLLAWMAGRGREAFGFVLLFAAAGLARAAGIGFLPAVRQVARVAPRPSIRQGVRAWGFSGRVRRLALYLWILHSATSIATPFFVPLMLEGYGYSYRTMAFLLAVPALVKIGTMRVWARMADRAGSGPMLRLFGWLVATIPALWFVSNRPVWILAAQVYAGAVWGAFELAQASAILQTTRGRGEVVALFNAVDGLGIVAGSLVGGLAVELFGGMFESPFGAPLAISSVLRFVPALLLLWRVRGLGKLPRSHRHLPLRLWSSRPTRGLTYRPLGIPLSNEPRPEDRP